MRDDERHLTEEHVVAQGDLFPALLENCFIGSMTPLIKKECFDTLGGFNENWKLLCFEDWEMWTRLSSRYPWTAVHETLGRYRLHHGNTQHAAGHVVDELRFDLMTKYPLTNDQRSALQKYIAARSWHWACNLYQESPRISLRFLKRNFKSNPKTILNRHFWGLIARCIYRSHGSQSNMKR